MKDPVPHSRPQGRVRLIVRAARLHARLGRAMFAGWLAGTLVTTAMPVGITWAFGLTVGGVPGAVERGLGSPAGRQLVLGLVAMCVMDLIHAPCGNVSWRCAELLGIRYRSAHRARIMRALVEPPGVAHLHDPAVLDATRAADNVWVKGLLEGIGNVGSNRLRGLGAALLVTWQHPPAGLLLAAAWLAYGRWAWKRASADASIVTGEVQALRRSDAFHGMGTGAPSAKETRMFGLGGFFGARFAAEWWRAMEEVWRLRRLAARGGTAVTLFLLAAHVVAFGLVARDAASGALTITALATALQAGLQSSGLGSVPYGHYEIEYGLGTLPNLDRLEELVRERAERLPGAAPAFIPRRSIRFEGLGFAYPRGDHLVLDGFDAELEVGTSLAIVGDNGAGKTTLVQLLARLRDPTSGRIAVDGVDLREIEPSSWQRMVAAVSQESLRLPLPVSENVCGGRDVSPQAMERAIDAAGARGVVDGLDRGLDTPLAREFSGGAELSGGQWQRLALARALAALEAGAEVLVLDEPTAHMDARGEAELYDRFLDITHGRTTVLISHRFSTVRRADRIVVVDGGRVVEEGTHDELVELGGRYARNFFVQASRFTGGSGGRSEQGERAPRTDEGADA